MTRTADLTLDPRNANRGTQRGRGALERSLRSYGAGRSILVDRNGVVIAGNKTLEVASEIGLETQVVETDGRKLIVVRRNDLDLTEKAARELALADNRVAELDLEWDPEVLQAALEDGLDLEGLWSDDEMARLLATLPAEGLTDPDAAPEAPVEPVSRLGDLWVLDGHRVRCGDSTSADDVGALLGAVKPHLMVTDPPYGVEYDPSWRTNIRGKPGDVKAFGTVSNDDRADWREAWALFPGEVAYVWSAPGGLQVMSFDSLEAAGFQVRQQIIWAKQHFAMGRGNYHYQHEPCWYAVRKGKTGHWSGDRKQTTLWQFASLNAFGKGAQDKAGAFTGHGTQKPVECMRRPMENNSSPGQAIYDPFLGSGTTIIAAEQTGRVCFGMELSPAYVDVIVKRWQDFTGKEATLEGDGRTFVDVAAERHRG